MGTAALNDLASFDSIRWAQNFAMTGKMSFNGKACPSRATHLRMKHG
jgi:hypothetical protein